MEDELLKRIKKLEDENAFLKERLMILERVRTPLSTIPIQKPSSSTAPFKEHSVPDLEIDDSLLYYLKSILGYSIKYNNNTIILRSVYAFSTEDTFEIVIQNNKLLLKDTGYLREWSELVSVYIKNGRSYCAFFAAVTLELYNRKTFGN